MVKNDTFCYFRTYITSSRMGWQSAMSYCTSQHTAGLVIWDTAEKYLDVKYIVGKLGIDAYTALYNPSKYNCASASQCSGQVVRLKFDFGGARTLHRAQQERFRPKKAHKDLTCVTGVEPKRKFQFNFHRWRFQ